MKLAALTGGIATGKSTVARMFAELGACVADADVAAREVVVPDAPAWREIVREFGEEILLPDRTLDRARLGKIVFADAARRARLEAITHPRIFEATARRIAECEAGGAALCLVDVPLLFEKGAQGLYPRTVLVYAPPAEQLRRLMARDGSSEADARARIAAQMPIDAKRALADYVIDNSGDPGATRVQAERVFRALLEDPA